MRLTLYLGMKKKRGTKGGLVTDEDYGGLGRSTDGIPRQ